jgi:hypothetical protein
MRVMFVAAAFALLSSAALSQTSPPAPSTPPPGGPPEVGSPLLPGTDAGLDKVASDGTTRTVRSVPCSKAARETDGTTTCIGIPGPVSTTTGSSRQ